MNVICVRCQVALQPGKAMIRYLDNTFEVDMHCCPSCGQVYVPESLAKGKMAEVERSLEDK